MKAFISAVLLCLFCFVPLVHADEPEQPQSAELTQAKFSDVEVQKWVLKALGTAYGFDAYDHKETFEHANCFFDPNAYETYYHYLKENRIIHDVVYKKATLKAVATANPKIVRKGLIQYKYSWLVELPLKFTITGKESRELQAKLTMLISRIEPIVSCEESLNFIRFRSETIPATNPQSH